MIQHTQFKTINELFKHFDQEETGLKHLEAIRWPDGNIVSPFDPESRVYKLSKPFKYKCRNTNRYFNVKTGTIFEDTKIKLKYWFAALYLLSCHKKGVSSHQLARDLGVTQKTGWFMLQRLRFGLQHEEYKGERFGTFEADATYIGGKEGNKHKSKKLSTQLKQVSPQGSKAAVFGIVERGGNVVTKAIPKEHERHVLPMIVNNLKAGSTLYTDEHHSFSRLPVNLEHHTVKHMIKEYVRGDVHTNTVENYWSVLKRVIYGTYHQVSHKHLQKYLNESAFRYNTRDAKANERFNLYLCKSEGRITYRQLTAEANGAEKTKEQKERYTRKEYRGQ